MIHFTINIRKHGVAQEEIWQTHQYNKLSIEMNLFDSMIADFIPQVYFSEVLLLRKERLSYL
jgi:hypothetical protein